MDSVWLDSVCEFVSNEADLKAYYAQLLELGARGRARYVLQERRAHRMPSSDPRYFIELARKELYNTRRSVRKIDRNCRRDLATGLYLESETSAGLDSVDEVFMEPFLTELVNLYTIRRQLARARGEDETPWSVAEQKALEAGVVDRFLRLRHEQARDAEAPRPGRQDSTGFRSTRSEALEKSLLAKLLRLAQANLQAAEAAEDDPETRQVHALRASSILVRVYRQTHAAAALEGLRKANAMQRRYYYRKGRERWKRAQLSVAAHDSKAAAEHYYWAASYFNKALARSVGERRQAVAREFRRLKQEIARWNAAEQEDAGTASPPVR
jgi:hypothetical protein